MAKKSPRPLTQREIKKAKKEKQREEYITIHNICKQMIPIQLKPPVGVDFFQGEMSVPLRKGKSAKFPKSRLRTTQIENLQKSGMIRINRTK